MKRQVLIIGGVFIVAILIVLILKVHKGKKEGYQRLPGSYPNSADLLTQDIPNQPPLWDADQWMRVAYIVDADMPKYHSEDPTLILYQNIADMSLYMLRDDVMRYQFTFRNMNQIQRGDVIEVDGLKYRVE